MQPFSKNHVFKLIKSRPHQIISLFVSVSIALWSLAANCQSRTEDIVSYNFETQQKNAKVFYPSDIFEVQNLIRDARQKKVQVRFSGASHSTSSVILDDGIYIKSQNLKKIIGIQIDSESGPVVEAEAGVQLGDLSDYVAQRGYSLGFAYPFFYGVTVGGLLSTGSHGTSRKHTALSSQNIVEVTLVNGRGDIVTIDRRTPEVLKAARVSLGLLGLIAKVKLKLIPDFNLEFSTRTLSGESALLARPGVVNWGPIADTEYLYWFPSQDRAVKVEGYITSKSADPEAQLVVLGKSNEGGLSEKMTYQALAFGMNHPLFNKVLEDRRFKSLSESPPPYVYLQNGKEIQKQGIVGRASKMLISKKIPLNPIYTTQDISFAFPIRNASRVMTLIHQFCAENDFYHPFLGVFLRFVSSDGGNYLSVVERPGQTAPEVYVLAEFFEPRDYSTINPATVSSQLRNQLLQKLTSENLITLHWGKNTDALFATQANKKHLGENLKDFEKIRLEMDPQGLFLNDFAERNVRPEFN